jgi:hypothetical protein
MAVAVKPGPDSPVFESPRALFPLKSKSTSGYDAAADGQRFLVLMPVENDEDARELTIITKWREFLSKKNR